MYKILIFKNRVKVDMDDDIAKMVDYHKRMDNLDVEVTIRDIDVPVRTRVYKEQKGGFWFGITGVKEQLRKLVKDNEYHQVVFAWNETESPIYNLEAIDQKKFVLTSWTNWSGLYRNTGFVQLVTSPRDDKADWIYKSLIHENNHVFKNRANARGANIVDVMDKTPVDGKIIPYYKNSYPEATDGNFARQREVLAPHWDKILWMPEEEKEYKYFSSKEIVGLKPELVELLDIARGKAGIPFVITSGHRTKSHNKEVGGVENSSHTTGLAVDLSAPTDSKKFVILKALLDVGFNRIGVYATHIHADMDSTKRQNVLWIN